MTAHHTILRNIADALTASTAIRDWCVAHFGRGCHVQLDAYGAAGLPGQSEAPFILLYSDGENDGAGEVDEETFEAILIAGIVSKVEGGTDTAAVSVRSATANGLTVCGIADQAEALRELALEVIQDGNFGANYRKSVKTASGTLDYPLQWARARMSFYEYQTL